MVKKVFNLLAVFLLLAFTSFTANAQDTVNLGYTITPKAGMISELEAALKKHVEWRIQEGDPWTWNIYSKSIGTDLLQYGIRSGNHSWTDLDDYGSFAPKGQAHFFETVSPYIETFNSGIDTEIESLAHWGEPSDSPAPLVQIITYDLKPDGQPAFMAAMEKVMEAVNKEGFPMRFGFFSNILGDGSGTISAVVVHENWASFQEPEENIMALLTKVHGAEEAQKTFGKFSASMNGSTTEVWSHRPDLSTPPKN